MRIAIIGIGGIGGYVGSRLATSYAQSEKYEIIFIQRGEHYNAIKKCGLTYITREAKTIFPHEIYEDIQQAGSFDVVFLTVKSRDLEKTTLQIKNNLHEKSIVITLLNGVNNAQRLQKVLPKTNILNGCIYVSATISEPGVIKQTGGVGKLIFGPENGIIEPFIEIEKLLIEAGIKTELTDNIKLAVWEKFVFISSWATISSKYLKTVGQLLKNDDIVNEWKELIIEIMMVAENLGILLPENTCDDCINRFRMLPYDNKTSMQLDIEAGKIPETDVFTKFISETAKSLKINTPRHNEALTLIESRK